MDAALHPKVHEPYVRNRLLRALEADRLRCDNISAKLDSYGCVAIYGRVCFNKDLRSPGHSEC